MAEQAGTIELVALELAQLLGRLAGKLTDDEVLDTLEELGVRFPDQLLTDPAITAARTTITTVTGQLDELVKNLTTAIDGGDTASVVGASLALVTQLGRITAAIPELAAALQSRGPTLPGITAAMVNDLVTDLPRKLTDLLLADLLQLTPGGAAILTLLGVLERTFVAGDPGNPALPPHEKVSVHLDRLVPALTDPVGHLRALYGWGAGTFDAARLLTALETALARLGLPVLLVPGAAPELQAFAVTVRPTADGAGLDVSLALTATASAGFDVPVSPPNWTAHVGLAGGLAAETHGTLRPPLDIALSPPSGTLTGEVTVALTRAAAEPFVLLGQAGGSRLEFAGLRLDGALRLALDPTSGQFRAAPEASGEITGGRLVIDLSGGDGFIATVTGGGRIESEFGVGFAFTPETGLRFHGSGGLEIAVPVHVEVGPAEITTLYLAARPTGGAVPVELSAGMSARLGPVSAAVDRIGVVADLGFPSGGGNLGPANIGFAFKPPNGVGLSVDAGLVVGGGYLFADPDRGEYAGALELEFADFLALKAIGLISTRMPDGSPGFSLLVVLTAEFGGTGIQLGYGFTLLAVGGILGLNRGMNLSALVEGVRTGAVDAVMFPRDVVANAPRILSDLRSFFPAEAGTFLIGPMAKIGWGTPTLISVSLGVVIEIPGNLAVLGVLRAVLPTAELPLLQLQVAFVGALEFDKQRLWFFAQIFDSRILTMPLTGGMGLVVAWGDNPDLVITVGGFHPAFRPPPLPFPVPDRLAVDVLNRAGQLIRVSGYFAITSNTVQFGGRAELKLGFGGFGIEGHLGFDALFQFSPFHFVVSVDGGVSLKAFGVGLFHITLHFQLEGPAPWRAHGRGSIGFLFFEISADFDITWGESRDTTLPPVDVLPLLAAEITKVEGWLTRLPSGRGALVNLRTLPATDELVLHPLGTLVVRQRALPLDIRVDRIGARRARDGNRFSVTPVAGSGFALVSVTGDKFAMAQYQDLSDAEKLSLPAYADQDAGVELAGQQGALASARVVRRSARFEAIVVDSRRRTGLRAEPTVVATPARRTLTSVSPAVFGQLLAGSSTSRSPLSQQDARRRQPFAAEDTVTLGNQRFVVAYVRNNQQAFPPRSGPATLPGGAAAATFRSRAAAQDALADWVRAAPGLAGTVHVIPAADAAAPLAVPNTWSVAGPLPTPAAWTTPGPPAVRLRDGRLLTVSGGAAALFDPVGGVWLTGPAPHAPHDGHTLTLLADGRVLLAGVGPEIYDPLAGTWTATGAASPRAGHSATLLPDGTVLVAGGEHDGRPVHPVERFDPATGAWTVTAPLTVDRSGHQAVRQDHGRVLVIGGELLTGGPRRAIADCEIFDPATGRWTPTGDLGAARAAHTATALPDGTVLVTGGDRVGVRADGSYRAGSLDSAERFDPATGAWTPAASLPGPRTRHRAVALPTGAVLLVGGTSGPGFTAGYRSVTSYDPVRDRWSATGGLTTGRWSAAVADLADGRIVVAGGLVAPGQPTAGTEIFTP
ncbi:DUF6603 domain-containing protein [Plantactinospora siamensis]|uniref:DUF6603 domain-containing protein n=1 Tax=Plantactinospora siamensis TaxID=555372 RepID=A0ABV6P338_9ACTN